MRLPNIHEEECGALAVFLIQGFKVTGPATEWWSRKAAEDEDEWMVRLVHASCDYLLVVERRKREVRRGLTNGRSRTGHQLLGAFPILWALFGRGAVHLRNETYSGIGGLTP